MTASEYRKLRQSLGLSQPQLAAQLGLDKMTVWRREKGELPVPLEGELALRYLLLRPASGPRRVCKYQRATTKGVREGSCGSTKPMR